MSLDDAIRNLYEREINCSVATFWDAGVVVEVGNKGYAFYYRKEFGISELGNAAAWLLAKADEHDRAPQKEVDSDG